MGDEGCVLHQHICIDERGSEESLSRAEWPPKKHKTQLYEAIAGRGHCLQRSARSEKLTGRRPRDIGRRRLWRVMGLQDVVGWVTVLCVDLFLYSLPRGRSAMRSDR